MADIAVLGGGFLGFSVALACRLSGHDVTIVAALKLGDTDQTAVPAFASAYPAASIIPHGVAGENVDELLGNSHAVFAFLEKNAVPGLRLQTHYEMFEGDFVVPAYRDRLQNFRIITDPEDANAPRRKGADVSGYAFDCYFCEGPTYAAWLTQTAHQAGINFVHKTLCERTLDEIDADILINCLGAGAHEIFPEFGPGVLNRGFLVRAGHPRRLYAPFSYNYTPHTDIYSQANGSPADVYFYPRDNHCILGGTRETGSYCKGKKRFIPDQEYTGKTYTIDGKTIPAPIINLNLDLLADLTGGLRDAPLTVLEGLRHMNGEGDDAHFVLKEGSRKNARRIIHCFGFGGAGVTLSWGAAVEIFEKISPVRNNDPGGAFMSLLSAFVDVKNLT